MVTAKVLEAFCYQVPFVPFRVRTREGEGRRTPVIAMTAAAMTEDREHALASGMDDFVAKPVTTADLESVLSRWALAPPAAGAVDAESDRADDSAPIDSSRLSELRMLGGPDGALMKRLFGKFGDRGRVLVATMQEAVAQEDAVVARAAAHGFQWGRPGSPDRGYTPGASVKGAYTGP